MAAVTSMVPMASVVSSLASATRSTSSHRDTSRFHPGTFHDRSLHHAHGRPLSHSLPQHTTHTGRRHVSMPAPETPYSIQQQMQECRLLFFFINSFPHFIFYSRLKNTTALFQNVGSEKNFLLIYITWKKLYNGMEQRWNRERH